MGDPNQVQFEFPQGNDVLKKLQDTVFEMAVTIKDIFERNGIRYVIEYGSLLGAVRHGGFIPWDDDFDFVVFEDDYQKASEALRRELPSLYVLHDVQSDPAYFYSFSKVRHLRSIAIEDGFTDHLKYKGVSIDLFKGKVEKNNRFARRLFLAESHRQSHKVKFRKSKSFSELVRLILYGFETGYYRFFHRITPKTDYFHKSPDTDQYFIPLEKYLPTSTVRFNEVEFPAPHDPDYVLTDRYGNWHRFPQSIRFHLQRLEFFDEK